MTATMAPTRQQRRTTTPTNGSGGGKGGASNLGRYRDWGRRKDPQYQSEQNRTASALGPHTHLINAFQREVGVQDVFNPGLVNAGMANKAEIFANTKVPKYLEYAKKYYTSVEKTAKGDTECKKMQVTAAAKYSIEQVNQQGMDHKLAQQQIENVVAEATMEWETRETYLGALDSLQMLAKSTMTSAL